MRADSQDSIKEVGHLPTSTSRGAFPQQSVCEREPEFAASRCSEYRDSLIRKKVGIPCSGLNAGSSFISQDKGMSESSVQSLEKALGPILFWTGGLTSLDTSRGPQSSMLQKVPRPDSSWKLIGIPISLWKIERDGWSPTSPPDASVVSCQT